MKRNMFRNKLAMAAAAVLLSAVMAVPVSAAGRLGTPEDVYWGGSNEDDEVENGTYAYWDEIEDAYEYEIYLYCDDSKVKGVKTKKTKFNFRKFMTKEGDYTFRVRALSKSKNSDLKTGSWSDYSDVSYISESRAEEQKNGGTVDTNTAGPGIVGIGNSSEEGADGGTVSDGETQAGVSGSGQTQTAASGSGQWVQDDSGWRYSREDGTFVSGGWFQDPAGGFWYFLQDDGYMKTGWIDWNGQRYYCDAQGTPSGAMVTGSKTIDGILYQFDAAGALLP